MQKSHLTAISRKDLPLPTKWLLENKKLQLSILDYGVGKCHNINNEYFVADGYDPHYRLEGITKKHYYTIICNYVLNVIEDEIDRCAVLNNIASLLSRGGTAYISVREDVKNNGYTSKGTWQGSIKLCLPIVHQEKGKYTIYKLKVS